VKFGPVGLMLVLLILNTACGGNKAATATNGTLSGNWQISLAGQAQTPLVFTGFMLQANDIVSGNVILGASGNSTPCTGVSPITGTVNGSNVSLTIDESAQQISLQGTSSPLAGQFSYNTGTCSPSSNTGTWSAVQVQPLTGNFEGTFTTVVSVSPPITTVLPVSGNLIQGPNTGDSTANITGTMQSTGSNFCPYISQASVSGLISGTSVTLNLYGPNGELITQLGQLGQLNNGTCNTQNACLLISPDGTSMTGSFNFPAISNACPAAIGTLQLTFSQT